MQYVCIFVCLAYNFQVYKKILMCALILSNYYMDFTNSGNCRMMTRLIQHIESKYLVGTNGCSTAMHDVDRVCLFGLIYQCQMAGVAHCRSCQLLVCTKDWRGEDRLTVTAYTEASEIEKTALANHTFRTATASPR